MTKLQIKTSEDGFGTTPWSAIDANTYDIAGVDELGHPYSNDPIGWGATEHHAVLDLLTMIHDRLDGREHDRAVYLDFCEWVEKRWSYREVAVGGPGHAASLLCDRLYIDTFKEASDEEYLNMSKGA